MKSSKIIISQHAIAVVVAKFLISLNLTKEADDATLSKKINTLAWEMFSNCPYLLLRKNQMHQTSFRLNENVYHRLPQ